MSNQPVLAYCPTEIPVLRCAAAPIDLCHRIYARNYARHQADQQNINLDWKALLAANH